ncbi:hypothetical protein [Bacteroides sp.]
MKQMKVLVLSLIVLMGVGFTSCMNSEDNSAPYWMGPVEVVSSAYGSTYFKLGEFKIYPTTTSLMAIEQKQNFKPLSTKMAYISCTYSADGENANIATTQKLNNVNLTYAVSLDGAVESVATKEASNDSISTAPVISLSDVMSASSTSNDGFSILHNRYLFVGISYFFQEYAHSLTLVNYPNEEAKEGTVVFYLRHTGTPEKEGVTLTSAALAGSYPSLYFKAFDLLNYLPTVPGKELKIIVKADINTTNNKLDSENTVKDKEYSITYKVEEEEE